MSLEEIVPVVIDDGHYSQKGANLSNKNHACFYLLPSLIQSGHSQIMSMDGTDSQSDFVTQANDSTDGTKPLYFSVHNRIQFGSQSSLVDTQNELFQLSEASRVLVHAMLHHMGLAGKKVHLITTSPMRRYFFADGDVNTEYIAKRNENLMKPVSNAKGESVEVVRCDQVPEGFASYLSLLIKYKEHTKGYTLGHNVELSNQDILLLDFGGQTINVTVVSNGRLMTNLSYSEEGMGALRIYEQLADHFKSYRRNITRDEITKAIETGEFYTDKRGTNKIDVSRTVDKVVRNVLIPGLERVQQRTPFANFDRIIASGGTAKTTWKIIKSIDPAIELIDDPVNSNAKGAFYNLLRERKIHEGTKATSD